MIFLWGTFQFTNNSKTWNEDVTITLPISVDAGVVLSGNTIYDAYAGTAVLAYLSKTSIRFRGHNQNINDKITYFVIGY